MRLTWQVPIKACSQLMHLLCRLIRLGLYIQVRRRPHARTACAVIAIGVM